MTLTNHLKTERTERAVYILLNVGIGDIRKTVTARDDRAYNLTSTGVVLVTDEKQEYLITMYLPNLSQLRFIFGDRIIPSWAMYLYKHNLKHYEYTKNMTEQTEKSVFFEVVVWQQTTK